MKPSLVSTLLAAVLATACADLGTTLEEGGAGPGEDVGDGADDGDDGEDGTGGGDGDGNGAAGARYECYGIADDLGEVFAIDRATGQSTHMCSVPGDVAEIDAISSHPTTGIYYFVSQSSAELGWFDPDLCDFHVLGDIEVTDLAGLTFHPETGVLYGGDQDASELYRFGQDASGAPTTEMTLVASLPATPKAIAIQPETDRAFVSDAETLTIVDLGTGEAGAPIPMSTDRVEALFFTVDGALHGVVDKDGELANHFVDVNPDTAIVSDVGSLNPVIYLPGSDARPEADDVEAMECNVGGVCTSCGVD